MNMKRMRGRNNRGGSGGGGGGGGGQQIRHHSGGVPLNRNHVFDSNGPDLRVRGTAQQLFEKYLQLGRDATSSGDRVMAESYFQHAEHYFRILNAMAQAQQQTPGGNSNGQANHSNGQGGGQQRRPSMHDMGNGDSGDGDDMDPQPGFGEQPPAENSAPGQRNGEDTSASDTRQIPIAAVPPEG